MAGSDPGNRRGLVGGRRAGTERLLRRLPGIVLPIWAAVSLSAVVAAAQDQRPTPEAVVGPAGDAVALAYPSGRPAAVDERRLLELGGRRINGRNNTSWPAPDIDRIVLVRLADGAVHEVLAPFETSLGWVRFSPEGSYLSYVVIRDTGAEQWVLDIASGIPRPVTSASLNAAWGEPCAWLGDGSRVLCRFLMSARGAPPDAADAQFGYYFTSQLGTVELATGRRTNVGAPELFVAATPSPDGQFVLVTTLGRPAGGAAQAAARTRALEIRNADGSLVRHLADLPAEGAAPARQRHGWNPTVAATAVWSVPGSAQGDRLLSLAAPFDGAPATLIETEPGFTGIAWTESGLALVTETDEPTGRRRTLLLDPAGQAPRTLLDWSPTAGGAAAGIPVRRPGGPPAGSAVMEDGDRILLIGGGARFLDRLDLTTLRMERLFESDEANGESVVAPLTADGRTLLIRRRDAGGEAGYFIRDTTDGTSTPLPGLEARAPAVR